jgi:hypothetical protein
MFSDNIKTYNLPLSYGFPMSLTGNKELLNLKLTIPYTSREVGDEKDSGLGDISLTTNYLIRFPQLLLDSKLVIKAPTGKVEDAKVALGTGSTDVAFYIDATWYMDNFAFKGGLGYGYNGNFDLQGTKVMHGDEYLVSGGLDYKINDTMKVGGLLLYQSRAQDKYDMGGGWTTYSPGINTLDLIPSFSYLYKAYNVEIIATAVIPVSDSWNDKDVMIKPTEEPDRNVKFSVSASKPF